MLLLWPLFLENLFPKTPFYFKNPLLTKNHLEPFVFSPNSTWRCKSWCFSLPVCISLLSSYSRKPEEARRHLQPSAWTLSWLDHRIHWVHVFTSSTTAGDSFTDFAPLPNKGLLFFCFLQHFPPSPLSFHWQNSQGLCLLPSVKANTTCVTF